MRFCRFQENENDYEILQLHENKQKTMKFCRLHENMQKHDDWPVHKKKARNHEY